MIIPGLVSATFRKREPHEVIDLAVQAGLAGIEWGGDVHVPHGDQIRAREVGRLTRDAGLRVIAYGSYFRFGPEDSFELVLETALALGAPLVRVWAGSESSSSTDPPTRAAIITAAQRAVVLAAQAGVGVAFEYHENTLADTSASAQGLLHAVRGARTLWQPPHGLAHEQQLASLQAVLPWLENLHVFTWQQRVRKPLADGERLWRAVLNVLHSEGRERAALLEFVANDDPQQFLRDASTLKQWLQQPGVRSQKPE